MFVQRRNRNLVQAAFTTLALIYHQTVHTLRQTHANAVIGILITMMQSVLMVAGFMAMYWVMGVKRSPIRGDFLLFIMSGIFMFMAFNGAMAKVSGAGKSTNQMMKHGPLNTAIAMSGAALAALYTNVLSALVLIAIYHMLINPIEIENWRGALAMLVLAWFSGSALGLVFLSIRTWFPVPGQMISQVFGRANMVASGKMFAANNLPNFMLAMFDWNPLFHIIDQTRGFVFVNYTPHNSSLSYPIYVTLALLMIGLMAEFVTRNSASLSWGAGR
ncbi:ABC transporter permease [Paracoccus sphaerophysae]|uniref:ABC transporter permease n=1 Tax=Paracoccus sphaerophysae TaxID=690417 RepID=UPI002352277E|nr:ABC transporter [Paracoccus sphaerophysae]